MLDCFGLSRYRFASLPSIATQLPWDYCWLQVKDGMEFERCGSIWLSSGNLSWYAYECNAVEVANNPRHKASENLDSAASNVSSVDHHERAPSVLTSMTCTDTRTYNTSNTRATLKGAEDGHRVLGRRIRKSFSRIENIFGF